MIIDFGNNFNKFKLLIGESNNIFVQEDERGWKVAMNNGYATLCVYQEKFPEPEQNILFVEQNFERPNIFLVDKIYLGLPRYD
jgi:hypothetical protein